VGVVLEAADVSCGYGPLEVVTKVSFTVSTGEVLCLLGANGAGKTTLFKAILGFLPLRGGSVLLEGRELGAWGRRELARTVAYVPQAHGAPFPFSVAEVVLMGRTPHLGMGGSPRPADVAIAGESLERLGIDHLARRPFTELSGGEAQMVLIARALTQQPTLLMMDEPTSSLDLANQGRVLRQVRRLAASGLAIMMISHTPDHAFAVATTAALLRPDQSLLVGPPRDVLTAASLHAAYGQEVLIVSGRGPDGAAVRSCVVVL
jgi:iron complex transport system ATP-binding protein